MKKKLFYLGAFLLVAGLFTSCELLEDTCQQCAVNVYDGAVFQYATEEGEYCGDELIAFKAAPDYTVPGTNFTAKAECE